MWDFLNQWKEPFHLNTWTMWLSLPPPLHHHSKNAPLGMSNPKKNTNQIKVIIQWLSHKYYSLKSTYSECFCMPMTKIDKNQLLPNSVCSTTWNLAIILPHLDRLSCNRHETYFNRLHMKMCLLYIKFGVMDARESNNRKCHTLWMLHFQNGNF